MQRGIPRGQPGKESINRKLARALSRLAPAELLMRIPFADLPLYSYDYDADFPQAANALKEAIAAVDAVLFVTPEYNRFDSRFAEERHRLGGRNSFARKLSAIIGTSPGKIGTAVGQQHLRSILGYCNSPQMTAMEVDATEDGDRGRRG